MKWHNFDYTCHLVGRRHVTFSCDHQTQYSLSGVHVHGCKNWPVIQGDSVARGPKLKPIKNYVIEIMTWQFIYTYRERWKTGPAHNRCWKWSPFTSKHTWMRFSKFWNNFSKVSTLTARISWRIASLSCFRLCGLYFCTLCPSVGPKERSRQALDPEIWVAKVFWDNSVFKKKLSISRTLAFDVWHVAPSCW